MSTQQLNTWDDELAKFAGEYKDTEDSAVQSGHFMSTRGGRLSLNGATIPGDKINIVIIDYLLENHYYEGDFDASAITSPVCFAFGRNDDEMVPHELSSKPQCATCAACPMNVFGTASKGKGKACKNIRRIGFIPADGLDNPATAEMAFLKLPVTSCKNFSTYVQQLASGLKRPPFGVVTEMSIVPDPKSQFILKFKLVDKIESVDVLKELLERRKGLKLDFPYQAPATPEPLKTQKKEKF